MNTLSGIFLAVTVVVAMIDWWAVAAERQRVERAAKPLTMVALGAALLALDLPSSTLRWWFFVGIAFSLVGDVFLMLPSQRWFPAGLGGFLVAQVCYGVGFLSTRTSTAWLLAGVVVMFTVMLAIGPTIVSYAWREQQVLGVAVAMYMMAISFMAVAAFSTGSIVAVVGALLFVASDATIGFTAFVQPVRHQRMIIMTTYHVAQVLIVLSLPGLHS